MRQRTQLPDGQVEKVEESWREDDHRMVGRNKMALLSRGQAVDETTPAAQALDRTACKHIEKVHAQRLPQT